MQCHVGGPHINSDPLSTPVTYRLLRGPIYQCAADITPGCCTCHHKPGDIHCRNAQIAHRPQDLVALAMNGDRGNRPAVFLDYPSVA